MVFNCIQATPICQPRRVIVLHVQRINAHHTMASKFTMVKSTFGLIKLITDSSMKFNIAKFNCEFIKQTFSYFKPHLSVSLDVT